jgi:energy-coupling factor transporter transmembrane protein EcfT
MVAIQWMMTLDCPSTLRLLLLLLLLALVLPLPLLCAAAAPLLLLLLLVVFLAAVQLHWLLLRYSMLLLLLCNYLQFLWMVSENHGPQLHLPLNLFERRDRQRW